MPVSGASLGLKTEETVARKKVLVISYYWYPFAGVGTYRISRFVKYLAKSGWEVVILTTKKAAAEKQEVPDDPVLKECKVYRSNIIEPAGLVKSGNKDTSKTSNPSIFYRKNTNWVSRLAVWIRLNLMIPDAKFTWKWFAVRLGKKVIKKEQPDLILSTSPPPSANLVALKLARWSRLPWIADFRDPWTNIFYYDDNPQSGWAKKKNKKLERRVLKSADRITLVNNGFFPENQDLIKHKSTVIPNGFDPDHIVKPASSSIGNNKFVIRYFGSLKANQYPKAFIEALKEIITHHSDQANKISFEFFGSIDPEIKKDLQALAPSLDVQFTEFIPHKKMMKLVQSADLLLLVIGRTKNSKFVLSTKIFEYMTSGKPVLGIGPLDGSAAALVKRADIGRYFSHSNSRGIKDFILQLLNDEVELKYHQQVINEYNFRYLTKQLEQIMDDLITS